MTIHSVPTTAAADKRTAILDAATATFAKHGFFGSQVADVARAAGIAAGTVYLYFRSKDEILTSIFDRTMQEAIREGRQALADVKDPVERLRRIARMHLARLGRDRNLAIVFQVELRQTTKFMEQFSTSGLREYLAVIQETIEHGQARGVFRRSMNARTASKVFFGALDEMATNWILSRRRYALEAQADEVVDMLVGGFGTSARTGGR
ncbi:MAG TPA: TetR/AcrR family transcriptional regulator [Vicinamibacterales bacterium]|nr:TetR/AcrR family transcriptional regulator [Vicinamibacterales bacterium]